MNFLYMVKTGQRDTYTQFRLARKVYCSTVWDPAHFRKLLLIMRLTSILLMLAVIQVTAAASEAQKISFQKKDATLLEVLQSVGRQTGYFYVCDAELLRKASKVNIAVKKAGIHDVLTAVFKDQPLTYTIHDKVIVVKEKTPKSPVSKEETLVRDPNHSPSLPAINALGTGNLLERINLSSATDRKVRGKVTDEKGEGLPGVSVVLKGTQRGTISAVDGSFELVVPDGSNTLIFSFVGYLTQEIDISSRSNLNVMLKIDNKALEEVVVVGYGTIKKSDLTGSITRVGEEAIKATPIVALDRALQGRAAGVMATASSGAPGASTTIRIRGTGSVNAGNDPLYVIDGFPTGNLNTINPNDIESIEILKDASATAIYGSRGSNGVVIVTTRRGKAGQSNINFESYYGVQHVRRKIPLLNAREYAAFFNEARVNAGAAPYFDGSTPQRPLPETLGEGTNWQDLVLRSAPIQNYQITFSGGESKTKYSISGNYFNQEGVVINSFFKRFTVRANIDREVKSWLKIGLSSQAAHSRSSSSFTPAQGGLGGGVINAALNFAPVFPIYAANGAYYRDFSSLNGNLVDNPVGLANERTDLYNTIRLLNNFFAEIRFSKDLVFRTSFGADLFHGKSNLYSTRLIELGAGSNGVASVSASQDLNWLNENTLSYTRTFADRLSVNALLGYTTQSYLNEAVTANAANFNNDFASYHNLGSGATLRAPGSSASQWALISYLSRVNLGWEDKYLLTLTARADGSSRFGPNSKYGFFPSGALAWRIINEDFMKDQSVFSDLKLRATYGATGNQSIGDYAYLSNIAVSTAVLGGANPVLQTGAVPGGISNMALGWEKNIQLDAGVDFSFFRDRLQFTADYYVKTTSDLLFQVNVPQTTGYSSSLRNIGKVENRGLEISFKSFNINRNDFQWNTEFNIAFNRNKVLRLDGRPEFLSGSGIGHLQISNTVLLRVGEALGNFYGREMTGIFQTQQEVDASAQPTAKPGDIRYRDINNDGAINDSDRTIIGNGIPKFFGGINNTFTYKGFDVNFFFQGSFGNDILNYGRFDVFSLNGNGNQSKDVLDRWTPDNPSNEIPRANAAGGRILSTFHIEDGSYLRLKNFTIGYSLPGQILQRIAVKDLRVYLSAQNYLTITNYKGFDPEVSRFESSSISQGMDFGGYPTTKTLLVGLNFNF